MKKETIDMKENFVRADGVSYREAVEKCIRCLLYTSDAADE